MTMIYLSRDNKLMLDGYDTAVAQIIRQSKDKKTVTLEIDRLISMRDDFAMALATMQDEDDYEE